MTRRPSRFVGLLFSIVAVGALVLFLRSGRQATVPAGPPVAQAGGELAVTIRSVPRSFNPLVATDDVSAAIAVLTQARLVRVNPASFELEPWLAEGWDSSADGLTHTLRLRQGLTWSDDMPFTSADVLFSLEAARAADVTGASAAALVIGGEPIRAAAPDATTVALTYPAPSGPGLRLLEALPIVPKHKLEAALASGTLASAWGTATAPAEIVGLGPFVLREYVVGERLVLERNPRYWRATDEGQPLPYLDRLVLQVVADADDEFERLLSGAAHLPHRALMPDHLARARRAEDEGRLALIELGVATSADAFWFCLDPQTKRGDPRFAFVQKREFRQAISHAVDREEFAHAVFFSEAVPVWGPVTPGNRAWFSSNLPRYPHDPARARALLSGIGLEDRDGNEVVEDANGTEARFRVLTQRGIPDYERGTAILREYAAQAGVALDIVQVDADALNDRLTTCNYDAIYMRPQMSEIDPARNLEYWLSSGRAHVWNAAQPAPATDWERQIDMLMLEQARTLDPERRRAIFTDVQRILAEHVPVLYFAAPRLFYAHAPRVGGVTPSVLSPPVLWNADSLHVAAP